MDDQDQNKTTDTQEIDIKDTEQTDTNEYSSEKIFMFITLFGLIILPSSFFILYVLFSEPMVGNDDKSLISTIIYESFWTFQQDVYPYLILPVVVLISIVYLLERPSNKKIILPILGIVLPLLIAIFMYL